MTRKRQRELERERELELTMERKLDPEQQHEHEPGSDRFHQPEGGMWAPTVHHRGKWSSWVSVTLMLIGSIVIGVALTLGPSWTLLIVGGALIAVGVLIGLIFDLMGDVVLDERLKGSPVRPGKAQRGRGGRSPRHA